MSSNKSPKAYSQAILLGNLNTESESPNLNNEDFNIYFQAYNEDIW